MEASSPHSLYAVDHSAVPRSPLSMICRDRSKSHLIIKVTGRKEKQQPQENMLSIMKGRKVNLLTQRTK